MPTIQKVFKQFLQERKAELSDRTYNNYESVIELFELFLNDYGWQFITGEDELDGSFTSVYKIEELSEIYLHEFFEYFLVRKVMSSKSFIKTSVTVIKKLMKWLHENEYMSNEEYSLVREYFGEGQDKAIVDVHTVSEWLYEYSMNSPNRNYEQYVEGYFTVTDVKSGQLFLNADEYGTDNYLLVGLVPVPKRVSDLCKKEWVISGSLGLYKGNWYFIETWNVYPNS